MSHYCVLAERGISVDTDGTLNPCCQFHEEYQPGPQQKYSFRRYPEWRIEMERLSEDLRNDVKDVRCRHCWADEDLGYQSLRQQSNKLYQHSETQGPIHVEVKLGNFCNLKCVMCSPYFSSSFETEFVQNRERFKEVGIHWEISKDPKWWASPEFKAFYDSILPSVELLHFTGGEPFMVPTLIDLLRQVPNKSRVRLLFVTNMTTLREDILEIFHEFASIGMVISLEGIGEKNDYVRSGSDFTVIQQNLQRLRQENYRDLKLTVNHVLQHTSVYSLPELVRWCRQHEMEMHFSSIFTQHMTINSVPPEALAGFKSWMENSPDLEDHERLYIQGSVDRYEFDPEAYAKFRKYMAMLDSIRGNDFEKTFSPVAYQ